MPISRRLVLAVALAASVARAAPAGAAGPEAEVEAAVDALTAALLAPDAATLDALVLDGLSYGHSSGAVQGKAAFVDALTSGRSAFPSIVLSDRSVSVVGEDAIARHVFSGEATSGGKTAPVRIGVMQVWHRDGGRWRLLARQAYKI
ncbi:nuclear transport factor 2 family protein [Methylobacterium sp. E-041]|uniref:nuclear transport factor 2 family protein n=1 Tax=unclassified Methylobacterium TaxID=2615210 RepID=UPI0011C89EF3|nr:MULTISPECIES: nuclear transport factor 2 family protein [unclassified Methylobacterium]MCJ2038780.1 nuclear transport factor 2 family protein [Methylobacterium sp. J-059]MCJ2106444.1 nuclear transport factor 2 family protein [Methylobacterium sp. E-041]TXN30731.1 nuclear transport factor 2 family protein [Methylobacterium sp. WL93]TXN49047.1 nuclear transport factor 2 family protein [Methylobacterium sp. WL119]TXN66362.1 nuclear transport factor 2 family protein [Methylobacterium sp. WL30]